LFSILFKCVFFFVPFKYWILTKGDGHARVLWLSHFLKWRRNSNYYFRCLHEIYTNCFFFKYISYDVKVRIISNKTGSHPWKVSIWNNRFRKIKKKCFNEDSFSWWKPIFFKLLQKNHDAWQFIGNFGLEQKKKIKSRNWLWIMHF
jgi:hypothetical protein